MARSPSSITIFVRQTLHRIRNPKSFEQTRTFTDDSYAGVSVDDKQIAEVAKQVGEIITTQPPWKWKTTILSEFPPWKLFHPNCVLEIMKSQDNALLSRYRLFQLLCDGVEFSPDATCCNALLDALVQAKAFEAAKFFMNSVAFLPEPDTLESYVCCLCEDGYLNEAVKTFSILKRLCSPSLGVWNSMLLATLKRRKMEDFWGLYGEMMECGVVGDADTAGHVIRALCKDNKLSEAYQLLQEVLGSGVVLKDCVFTELISGYCKEKDYDRVSAVLHFMIAKNCAPSIYTYQEIIHWLSKNEMGHEAFRIFNELQIRGYSPDRVMYTTMIHGLCKKNWMVEARLLWFEMLHNGFLPEEHVFNVLIKGFFTTDELDGAWKLWNETCNHGIRPTTSNYNTMMEGLCSHGKMDEVQALFEELQRKEIKPNMVTHDTIIKALCTSGKNHEAMNLYHELVAAGSQLSAASYLILIRALSAAREVQGQGAIDLLNDMLQKDVKPLVHTRDYIIRELFSGGNVKEGMNFLTKMLQNKLTLRPKTFNVIIRRLTSDDWLDEAFVMLNSMFGMGYAPELPMPAFYKLVDHLCKENSDRVGFIDAEFSNTGEMTAYLWKRYAEYLHTKWEKTFLWGSVEHYRRHKTFRPFVTLYATAFYTGIIGAAITEQLYKEKYWEEHPGEAVVMMKPKFYYGPWTVLVEDHFPLK